MYANISYITPENLKIFLLLTFQDWRFISALILMSPSFLVLHFFFKMRKQQTKLLQKQVTRTGIKKRDKYKTFAIILIIYTIIMILLGIPFYLYFLFH